MPNSFEDTLADIISQKSEFESVEEREVERSVILRLLAQVGWNIYKVSEIKAQRSLSDGGKVDFDLQIGGKSQILIEVKSWRPNLDGKDEDQLARYCRLVKPKLGVLTSGQIWRLYLPPTGSKNAPLRRFLEFDITKAQPTDVENSFRRFLSRDSMVNFRQTVAAARKLHSESKAYQKFRKNITKAWNELPNDKDTLTELVLGLATIKGIPASPDNVLRFLDSLNEPLLNEVGTGSKSQNKPASYSIYAFPTGQKKMPHTLDKKSWNFLMKELCELMYERHPESFREKTLSVTDRFARRRVSKYSRPVGDTGIFTKKLLTAGEIRDACYQMVTKFDYPSESLVIKDSNGTVL